MEDWQNNTEWGKVKQFGMPLFHHKSHIDRPALEPGY
jgi:hypothetical protein